MKTDIYIATHKKIDTSFPDYCHKIQVNALGKEAWTGYIRDDEGENISAKNPFYCELTALYSLWKNSKADIKGLFHYRRILGSESHYSLINTVKTGIGIMPNEVSKSMIKESEIIDTLKEYDMIVPFDNYPFGLSVFEDLQRFVYLKDILKMIDVIEEMYPDYIPDLWHVLGSFHISYCNMYIAPSDVSDTYCEWLFGILAETEKCIDTTDYDTQHKRVFGYLAEVLLNVYIRKNQLKVRYTECLGISDAGCTGRIMIHVKRLLNYSLAGLGIFPVSSIRAASISNYKEYIRYLKDRKKDPDDACIRYKDAKEMLIQSGASHIIEENDYCIGRITYRNGETLNLVTCSVSDLSQIITEADKLREYSHRIKESDPLPGHFYFLRIAYSGKDNIDDQLYRDLIKIGIFICHIDFQTIDRPTS